MLRVDESLKDQGCSREEIGGKMEEGRIQEVGGKRQKAKAKREDVVGKEAGSKRQSQLWASF